MSNPYVTQQFQPPQGLQPAIPFERPPPQSRTPLRPRVETPIHPPQVPQSRTPQPAPAPQQQPHQIPQAQPPSQIPQALQQRQPTHPPQPLSQPQPQPQPQPQQRPPGQHPDLEEQFRQAEQAYNAAYHPNSRPQAVYHTIDPTKTTITREPSYTLYRPPPPGTPQGSPPLRFIQPQPTQANGQPLTPQQQTEAHDDAVQDETMQDDDSGSDEADGEEGNTNEADGTPAKDAVAPRTQEVTPLQYPAVRPTLLLGPYETREEATTAAIEYGIAQGYMLVMSGCARAKTSWGQEDAVRPIVRVDFMCDRSGTCKNSGAGKRKRPTHKIGCPTRIKVVCRKRDGCKWFIDPRVEMHNHDLNLGNMESIASYRRWRRIQGGGKSVETRRERSERKKRVGKPRPPAPVPPPTFHNAGPQPPTEPTGPVHMAALKGQTKILEILLTKGGDIDAYDSTGRTALHCAIEGSRMDAFKLLIERGADVTLLDSKGLSPLRMAVEKGMEDAVVVLIEKGADPNR